MVGIFWIVTAYFIPVGQVHGDSIYRYQIKDTLKPLHDNAIREVGKERVFYEAMSDLQISVSEEDLQKALDYFLSLDSDVDRLKKTIEKGLLAQQAEKRFAEEQAVTEEEIVSFYEDNRARFSGSLEDERENISLLIKTEKGERAFHDFLSAQYAAAGIMVY